jgi:hypothetical protein
LASRAWGCQGSGGSAGKQSSRKDVGELAAHSRVGAKVGKGKGMEETAIQV